MKKLNPLEFQTGFLMGACFGFLLEMVLLFFYNRYLCVWFNWQHLNVEWWFLIPVPILFGLMMGNAIANLHLEDY